jgi:hypothetical protein
VGGGKTAAPVPHVPADFFFLAALDRRKRFCEHEYVVFGSTLEYLRMISYTIVARRNYNPENYHVLGFTRMMAYTIVASKRIFWIGVTVCHMDPSFCRHVQCFALYRAEATMMQHIIRANPKTWQF